ncbi:hypothetical protein SAMN05414139_02299 [Burkholderia sp. D7]|nr:hypothetical protein SAMN05414139_02299 [Burkholderia sp. D7]
MLLPMSGTLVRKVSLQNHLALVALRQGRGNVDLAAELLKTVFVTFYLSDPACLAIHLQNFTHAEAALLALMKDAASSGNWRLDETGRETIEVILALHDQQLTAMPAHRIEREKQRLMHVLAKDSFPRLSAC